MRCIMVFEKGKRIPIASGGEAEVIEKLGEGGQGVVYRVKFGGRELALKWYYGRKLSNPKRFYDNLVNNIKSGAPTSSFLWPITITEEVDGSFGYLMELRPAHYREFSRFLLAKERFDSLDAVIRATLDITGGFRALHNRGFSYQDLNDGNFFVNPKTGEVLICDNDNVAPYGENLGIAGKCRYMAPEVVIGKKRPDIHTDRFSLAIVLYLLLFLNHPLEGQKTIVPCLTEELERKFYGTEPVFVWDVHDQTNRPVRGIHANEIKLWPMYPKFVRDAFTNSFSRDLLIGADTEHRVQEKEWQEIFTKLRDLTVRCDRCKSETFLDESGDSSCLGCGTNLGKSLFLKVKRFMVPIVVGKQVYACHVRHDSNDFREVCGEIIQNKRDPNLSGLRNATNSQWVAVLPNGNSRSYGKGETIRLGRGIRICFGSGLEGEVV